ncbi:YidC/Oxa1 family membrane protein insertase [Dyadobacter jejuensis]|uniref:Membrane protein insertase YidC n=1 Tax=Dyadobacter jejuensis TaxID=1082580 RepID=A0A316AMQ2_9BACT|nr:membrane protein insertase YidC [Dyadobacter jejuensis]PWJ59013.1 YidC/Oxa1 family membrane protein insertase [Dyadobacter jejuensis]
MDKNFVIGMMLIMLMLLGYQMLVPAPEEPAIIESAQVDTPSTASKATLKLDSTAQMSMNNDTNAVVIEEKEITFETKTSHIVLTNKGGQLAEVKLKDFETYDGKPLYLIAKDHNQFRLDLPTPTGTVDMSQLFFTSDAQGGTVAEGDSVVVRYRADLGGNQYVEQTYVIHGDGYLIDYGISSNVSGVDKKSLKFNWENDLLQLENDMTKNREVVTLNYYTDDINSLATSATSNEEGQAEEPVQWFTMKHKYFLSGLISKATPLQNMSMRADVNTNDSIVVKTMSASADIPMSSVLEGKASYKFYLGPNDYQIVGKVDAVNFDENVYLGYAFLKPVNKYFLVPLFFFLEKFIENYGLLIICLVLIVKLLLSPLTYKSYISMAKMKLLAPELEEIREKTGDDPAKQQQEQMKLYQQVGVSPLSGCVPVLATMPILFSLFFLFPNLIELRQESFLWATDLSTYDSFIKLPMKLPFYGDHVSLFTIMMTLSSIGYAYYNNQMTPTQPGPVNMKALGYVMPVMFMFVLNSFPAGLTFYYFVSNVVTIIQQLIIKRFVNEEKIKAILDENRIKNASGQRKQTKFQKYLEKSLQAADEAKKKQAELEKRSKKK